MAREKQRILAFRCDDQLHERIIQFAYDNELYNAHDEPNISASSVLLISMALEGPSGDQQRLIREAYVAGRDYTKKVFMERFSDFVRAVSEEKG